MNILAIDPGCAAKPTLKNPRPGPALHGWCIVRILPGLRPEWVDSGHDDADVIHGRMAARPEAMVVEQPGRVHTEAANMPLLQTAFAAGQFYGQALERGLAATLTAETWRATVTGLRSPSDAQVKAALGRMLDLPARSNAHERDACGLAVGWALRTGVLIGGRGRTPRPTLAGGADPSAR
jgi:hypothetical protein